MFLRYVERLFWTAGAAAIGYSSWLWVEGAYAQKLGAYQLLHSEPLRTVQASAGSLREGALFGQIEIPAIGLEAIIFEGTSDTTLTRGVGHLSTSSRPDSKAGNIVLAAHRDTFFRPLRKIQPGHEVTLLTTRGLFRYVVESTATVEPTDLEVIQPTPNPVLTLITCYPFTFIGNAPERYIVRAVPIS
jgi:sortase A